MGVGFHPIPFATTNPEGDEDSMAILKAKYATQDDIPEAVRDLELYEERGGEWLLKRDAIEGVKTAADVERVQTALTKATSEAKEAKAKLAKLGDRDIDEVLTSLDEVEALRAQVATGDGKNEEAIAKRIAAEVATKTNPLQRQLDALTRERDELKAENGELSGTIKRGTLESSLTDGAAKAGVKPEAMEDVKIVGAAFFEVNSEGRTVTRDGIHGVIPGLDPETWFADQKDKRSYWWPSSVGGGAGGNNGRTPPADNPFAGGGWNRTKQAELAKTNPSKADQLAKQAGFESASAATLAGKPIEAK